MYVIAMFGVLVYDADDGDVGVWCRNGSVLIGNEQRVAPYGRIGLTSVLRMQYCLVLNWQH